MSLAEFSVRCEDSEPGLSQKAWQLAVDQLVGHDVDADPALTRAGLSPVDLEAIGADANLRSRR